MFIACLIIYLGGMGSLIAMAENQTVGPLLNIAGSLVVYLLSVVVCTGSMKYFVLKVPVQEFNGDIESDNTEKRVP